MSRMFRPSTAIAVAAVVLACLVADPTLALAKKKGGKKKGSSKPKKINTAGIKEDIAQAQAVAVRANAVGMAAHHRYNTAHARAASALSTIEQLKAEARELGRRIQAIEENVELKNGKDTPLGRVREAVERAEKEYNLARHRVFESPAYKSRYQAALHSADKATLLPQIRREAEETDPAYQEAKRELGFQRMQYEKLLSELVEQDASWTLATTRAKEVSRQIAEASDKAKSGLVSRAIEGSNTRNAYKAAAAARAEAARHQAALKKAEAHNKKVGGKSSSGKKK
jgi:hypothetical protein